MLRFLTGKTAAKMVIAGLAIDVLTDQARGRNSQLAQTAPESSGIVCRDLANNRFGYRTKQDLCNLFTNLKSKDVDMSNNQFGKLPARDFANVIGSLAPEVEEINLTFNDLETYTTPEWLEIIAAIKPTLKKITLHGNQFGLRRSEAETLEIIEAFSNKLENLDISYTGLHGKGPDFYQKLFKIADKFNWIKLDYFSMFDWYTESNAKNDALVLEFIQSLPHSETRLGWFWLNGQNLSKFKFDLLLKIIANAPAHLTELNMHGAGCKFGPDTYRDEYGILQMYTSYKSRYSVEQWQAMLAAAPATIKSVSFYDCRFGDCLNGNQLARILGSLSHSVEDLCLGHNYFDLSNSEHVEMLCKAFAVLKPELKTLDLRLNYCGDVPIAEFIKLLQAIPKTVEMVYFPENLFRISNWNEADIQKLYTEFPKLCSEFPELWSKAAAFKAIISSSSSRSYLTRINPSM